MSQPIQSNRDMLIEGGVHALIIMQDITDIIIT
jgi:hypothetical protein